ncbi:hypothetical protein ACFQ78_32085 [Streptomyces sp. NPDC056519]|uniref:hypothetical protein n=1 Tax=Streptomyces sp. NPDC056519 TaxID=3345849 RepID=UPI0036A8E802
MPYVFLGRPTEPKAPMPGQVVIPPGTMLCRMQGGDVVVGPAEEDVLDQVEDTREPPTAWVRSNLALSRVLDGWDEDDGQFEGNTLVLPGVGGYENPVYLCTDTTGACPSSLEQAEAGVKHGCKGVLSLHAGEHLYWLECDNVWILNAELQAVLPLMNAAEAALSAELCRRSEAVLRAELPRQTAGFVPMVTRAIVGDDPRGFTRRVTAQIRSLAAEGRDMSAEQVLRIELDDWVGDQLDVACATFTAEVLRDQTESMTSQDLRQLVSTVVEQARGEGGQAEPDNAVRMLGSLLQGRLEGERDDLVDQDLYELFAALRDFMAALRTNFLAAVVGALLNGYRRRGSAGGRRHGSAAAAA